MDRLETRELASFLAVAEELHFGRAAAQLGVSQPALSTTIRRLERRLGVELFARTSRSVALTEPGRVLARESRTALDAVSAATARARRAGDPRLVSGARLPIDVVFGADRVTMLRDGRADVALLYTPPDDTRGLVTEVLLREPAVAVLPAEHRLAGRTSLTLADLDGETLHGHPAAGEPTSSIGEVMHLIALGRTVAVLPQSLTEPLRADLVTVAMADVAPSVLCLAWPDEATSPATAALAQVVGRLAAKRDAALSDER